MKNADECYKIIIKGIKIEKIISKKQFEYKNIIKIG